MERPNPQEAMNNPAQGQWHAVFQNDRVYPVKAMNYRVKNMKENATAMEGTPANLPRTLYVREFVHINFPVRMRLVGACPPRVAQTEAWLQSWPRKGDIWRA
jgi:hypothetical protein